MSKAKKADTSSDEDLVDPLETLRAECRAKGKCVPFSHKLDECNERVGSRSQTLETCVEELFDFLHCVDHCASKNVLKQLK